MDKKSKNTLIVSIIALALVLIGVTYAYFSARITGLESASTLSLTAGRMGIVYTEGDENVSVNNIYPREQEWLTKTFTLTGWNTIDMDMEYSAGLNVTTNGFNDYLTYDLRVLESTNGTPIPQKIGNTILGTGYIFFGNGTFTQADGDIHRYELKIYFKDNGQDQNVAQGAEFNAKIFVIEHKNNGKNIQFAYKTLNSYDVDYDACISYYTQVFNNNNYTPTQEDLDIEDTICSGEEYQGNDIVAFLASDGLQLDDIIDSGIITNVDYTVEPYGFASYTINSSNCRNFLYNYIGDPYASTVCDNGIAASIIDGTVSLFNLNRMVYDGYFTYNDLASAGAISNLTFSDVPPVGYEFVDGQYVYRYKQTKDISDHWLNMSLDGWGMSFYKYSGISVATSKIINSINGIPLVSIDYAYYMQSNLELDYIDLTSLDYSNIVHKHFFIRYSDSVGYIITDSVSNANALCSSGLLNSPGGISVRVNNSHVCYLNYWTGTSY